MIHGMERPPLRSAPAVCPGVKLVTYLTAAVLERTWERPRLPAKADGRRGTRRAWKRAHPPHWIDVDTGERVVVSVPTDRLIALRDRTS